MRLIDADKLRHDLIKGHDLVGAKYVDMADTVEAIPIEWISDYIHKAFDDEREAQDIIVMCYVWNLEQGRKENETN